MSGLKELQNSWRIFAGTSEYPYATKTFNLCANALSPHIEHMEALESRHRALVEAAREAILQIEYLHDRFGITGSGEQCLAKLRQALQEDNK